MEIILASTSPYRRRLLERLHLPFRCIPPEVEEVPGANESPAALARRLAEEKASAVAAKHPGALVIGSDQVASLEGHLLHKPGDAHNARAQLMASVGKTVEFHTGLALLCRERGFERFHVEPFAVRFRTLQASQLARYVQLDQPYDCAGSFKAEGLGIALFEALEGTDPSALEGLPLIALTTLLAEVGVNVI